MIILHAGMLDDRLAVWGETPPDESRPDRRRMPAQTPKPSPHDAGAKAIAQAIAGPLNWTPRSSANQNLVAWLPTVNGQPLASSPLIAEAAEPQKNVEPRLEPWAIEAIALTTGRAVDLLGNCLNRTTLELGVLVGSTLAYWSEVLRFAGSLVAREQFLPGLSVRENRYQAVWEPVLDGADAHRFSKLVRALPSACRALTNDASTPPETPAGEVLKTALGLLVDHLVRISAASERQSAAGASQTNGKTKSFASIHDRWLHALSTSKPRLTGDAAELDKFARQLADWRRPIAIAASAPFRLCFRLEEPESKVEDAEKPKPYEVFSGNGQDRWYVRYLLQSAEDPSLLVPVRDAWKAKGEVAALLRRGAFNPQEYLLSALGQASALCPNIETSLKSSAPDGYPLDTVHAHEFLNQKSWLLEQAGFGVLLPSWWTRKGAKQHLALKADVKTPEMTSLAGLSLDQILKFRWKVALGDQELTLEELQALAKLKSPLVRVRGQWVQLSAEEIQAAIKFWKNKAPKSSARQLVHMALGMGRPESPLAFEGVEAEGWMADVLKQLEGHSGFEDLPPPAHFQGTLRPYQQRGYSWLSSLKRWGFGACLADDMGLGKTVQTLAAIEQLRESGERRPTLLICPMSVVGNWQREAARFTPDLPVMVHHGTTRLKKSALFKKQVMAHGLVLSSYALLHRDFELFKKIPWAGVILDEAQNIKNPETKQARSARTLKADYRVALTGTPVENHVGDLWSIMEFLNPGLLGTQSEFKRSFHIPIQAHQDPDATRQLQRLTGPFILRRVKTDKSIIADLPDKFEMKVFCHLTKEQMSLYQAVADEAVRAIEGAEGIQRKGIVLATLAKLKQVCNHPAQLLKDNSPVPGRSGKLARLTEMLEEALEVGDRALVFTQFAEMGEILRRYLQESFGREVLFLHGAVPKKQRDRMVERFQSDSNTAPPVFLLSLKAGGTGLNLTGANHVFHFDRWWNPAVENQATDRAFRIGQTKKVQVHKFVCVGTMEEKIDALIERKELIAGKVVGSGEDWLTKLSTSELKELFALRREALAE